MMNCFPCFQKSEKNNEETINDVPVAHPKYPRTPTPQPKVYETYDATNVNTSDIQAKSFTFRELATATKNFRHECSLGECIFGRIYRGTLQPNGEVVSVKRLDKNRIHGNKEFLLEIYILSLLNHSNLHKLTGYCADGDQRLLVYDFMPMGSLEDHLLDQDAGKKSLDWLTRMKIACGIGEGIEYLHEKANPAIIYRDLKCSNIMLDEEFNPKLSDYGLAKLGANNMSNVTVMGTHGYCAPEYQKHGELTAKSDVYNFGVVLLELISGRRALDTSKPADEQNLITWAQPIFRNPKRFPEMADPHLGNAYPEKSLNQAVGIVAMCLQDEPDVRPFISDVVASLGFLAIPQPENRVASQDDHPGQAPEREASPDDHHVRWSPELKAQASQVSHHNETDHSEQSSEASWSDYEESFNKNRYEGQNDDMDERSDSDIESESSELSSLVDEKIQQEKQKSVKYGSSWGHLDSLEYEVASMSSSSSNSDNKSPLGSIDKKHNNQKFQDGNSSSRRKCKSRKIPNEERRDGISTVSRRSSRKKGGPLGWKGRNDDMVSKNENIGSYSRKSSNEGSDNGLIYEKNHRISSNSSQSSSELSEDGSVRSDHHHIDNEGLEEILL